MIFIKNRLFIFFRIIKVELIQEKDHCHHHIRKTEKFMVHMKGKVMTDVIMMIKIYTELIFGIMRLERMIIIIKKSI